MFSSLITNMFALAQGVAAPWWNIPSFEVWRWVNLIIFVVVFVYILRRPVSDAMRARREGIRRDLMRAQEERNAALAKLEEVETRLARLDAEVASIHEQSQKEAAEERERIRRSTEEETQKLREQSRREIESAGKVARQELREFAAGQSVRLAEEMIRRDIKPEDDARLVNLRVEELGGVKR
ncbi:MAG TPA: ATP synthase F0 subunit B [Pyrinomonadaceae bacterium]|jgi:ATP synthase F0 subunit b|nr:ATP synthase F0 subunit B [Pyrinomonadaceae bacterium]